MVSYIKEISWWIEKINRRYGATSIQRQPAINQRHKTFVVEIPSTHVIPLGYTFRGIGFPLYNICVFDVLFVQLTLATYKSNYDKKNEMIDHRYKNPVFVALYTIYKGENNTLYA